MGWSPPRYVSLYKANSASAVLDHSCCDVNCLRTGPQELWAGTVSSLRELKASVFRRKELNSAGGREAGGGPLAPEKKPADSLIAACEALSGGPS